MPYNALQASLASTSQLQSGGHLVDAATGQIATDLPSLENGAWSSGHPHTPARRCPTRCPRCAPGPACCAVDGTTSNSRGDGRPGPRRRLAAPPGQRVRRIEGSGAAGHGSIPGLWSGRGVRFSVCSLACEPPELVNLEPLQSRCRGHDYRRLCNGSTHTLHDCAYLQVRQKQTSCIVGVNVLQSLAYDGG